jgi:heme-degrading monooxygenase HmoA
MATVLWIIKATITAEEEEAFNHWYNTEHCPQVLRYRGAVSARRYKTILSNDQYQYMTLYEFDSEETFATFQKSEHLVELKTEYDAHFGTSVREPSAYVQVWP